MFFSYKIASTWDWNERGEEEEKDTQVKRKNREREKINPLKEIDDKRRRGGGGGGGGGGGVEPRGKLCRVVVVVEVNPGPVRANKYLYVDLDDTGRAPFRASPPLDCSLSSGRALLPRLFHFCCKTEDIFKIKFIT